MGARLVGEQQTPGEASMPEGLYLVAAGNHVQASLWLIGSGPPAEACLADAKHEVEIGTLHHEPARSSPLPHHSPLAAILSIAGLQASRCTLCRRLVLKQEEKDLAM